MSVKPVSRWDRLLRRGRHSCLSPHHLMMIQRSLTALPLLSSNWPNLCFSSVRTNNAVTHCVCSVSACPAPLSPCHVVKDGTLTRWFRGTNCTNSSGNTLIWRLNEGMGGLGVTHRLPLALHCAKWKCELTRQTPLRQGKREGQCSAAPRESPLQMIQLFWSSGLHAPLGGTVVKHKLQWEPSFPPPFLIIEQFSRFSVWFLSSKMSFFLFS